MPLRTVILIISIFGSTLSLAQSPDTVFIRQDHNFDDTLVYAVDTVVFESGMRKQILMGTTVLPGTHNQMNARGSGLWLEKVAKSNCRENAYEKWSPDRVVSVINSDTSLIIDLNITDNCCYEFLCDASVDSSQTLHLIYYGYGTYCACECCFGLTFFFSKIKDPEYKHIQAIMINDDRKSYKKLKR